VREVQKRLPASAEGLLHPGRGHRRWRAGHGEAVGRVDDRDGVANASGVRLVELHARLLVVKRRGHEGRRSGVERERRDLLRVLRRRRVGRVTRQRRPV